MERRSDQIIRDLRQLAENRKLSPGAVTVSADMADFIQDKLWEAADMLEELRDMAEGKTQKKQQQNRMCGNCTYSTELVGGALACMAQKGMPTVRAEDACTCEYWNITAALENPRPKIEDWVVQGIRIAQEKGKSAEELCAMIRSGWAIAALFDAARRKES